MMITERQENILNILIKEYINSAQPVSSKLLEKKHDFGVCPATIRTEMQKLTDAGFLYQPYTSAGRVPTDKGYRFFVNELLEKEINNLEEDLIFDVDFRKEMEDSFKFVQSVTKFLATESSNLALGYLSAEEILMKEGWKEIFEEPEFRESDCAARFTKMIDDFERNINNLFSGSLEDSEIQVYIGKENPASKIKDFSIIALNFASSNNQGIFAILGPKRMGYSKNISLLYNLKDLLK